MATTAASRAALRDEARQALLTYLQAQGSRAAGADAVRAVAANLGVSPSAIVAAMWSLVDEGTVEYDDGAQLALA